MHSTKNGGDMYKIPPPKKNKNKKDNKMKNICSGSSGKGGANEEIIK